MSVNHHQLLDSQQVEKSASNCAMHQYSNRTPSSQERGGQPGCHFSVTSTNDAGQIWYPNSGSTNHITNDVLTLNNPIEYTGMSQLLMGNGVPAPIIHEIKTRTVLLVGHIHKGLYHFDTSPQQGDSAGSVGGFQCAHTAEVHTRDGSCSMLELWHKRLGHPCIKTLHQVLRSCNIFPNKSTLPRVCAPCQLEKSHKLVSNDSQIVYSSPFELVV
ncbi:uncharacterized protein [Gossypium hirsutum]|uniref:GAG-pre-integrase domain-containing protein n=1 Tax=Gossypium hirsutum TaxID=3635 RepID=A0ABM3AHK6_GOSHI|nr:uncharacterized protein LOC121219854 [Gossypium hirsutum]